MNSDGYCNRTIRVTPCIVATTAMPPTIAFRSRHPGGVQMAFCDGSVKFIKNTINLFVCAAWGRPRAARSSAPTPTDGLILGVRGGSRGASAAPLLAEPGRGVDGVPASVIPREGVDPQFHPTPTRLRPTSSRTDAGAVRRVRRWQVRRPGRPVLAESVRVVLVACPSGEPIANASTGTSHQRHPGDAISQHPPVQSSGVTPADVVRGGGIG